MKKLLIGTVIACGFSAPARATYYNTYFDCGDGQTVWIGNPIDRARETRRLIFEIRSDAGYFDFTKPVRSPVIQWDADKDEVTFDGRQCRKMTEEEVDKLGHQSFYKEEERK